MSAVPMAYNFARRGELDRWIREVAGYLRDDPGSFVNAGTDRTGRRHALEAAGAVFETMLNRQTARDARRRKANPVAAEPPPASDSKPHGPPAPKEKA